MSEIGTFGGLEIIVSDLLPIDPSPGEIGRRIVRHGLADILEWLGEEVGPKPEDKTTALIFGSHALMARDAAVRILGEFS
jgi:hypothetical protein